MKHLTESLEENWVSKVLVTFLTFINKRRRSNGTVTGVGSGNGRSHQETEELEL